MMISSGGDSGGQWVGSFLGLLLNHTFNNIDLPPPVVLAPSPGSPAHLGAVQRADDEVDDAQVEALFVRRPRLSDLLLLLDRPGRGNRSKRERRVRGDKRFGKARRQ